MSEPIKLNLPEGTEVHWCNLYDEPADGWAKDLIFITLPNGFVLDADESDAKYLDWQEPHYCCSVIYPQDWGDQWTPVVSASVRTMPQLVAQLEAWAKMDWLALAPMKHMPKEESDERT